MMVVFHTEFLSMSSCSNIVYKLKPAPWVLIIHFIMVFVIEKFIFIPTSLYHLGIDTSASLLIWGKYKPKIWIAQSVHGWYFIYIQQIQ